MKSKLLDSIFTNIGNMAANDDMVTFTKMEPLEEMLTLRFLALLSSGALRYDRAVLLSSERVRNFASKLVTYKLVDNYSDLNDLTLQGVKIFQEVKYLIGNNKIGYTEQDWDYYLAKTNTALVEIISKTSTDPEFDVQRWVDHYKPFVLSVAVGLKLIDAQVDDKLDDALRGLATYSFVNPEISQSIKALEIYDEKLNFNRPRYESLTPFIAKYKDKSNQFTDRAIAQNLSKIPETAIDNQETNHIYAKDYKITADMIDRAQKSGDINVRNKEGCTLLINAVFDHDADFAKALIAEGIDLNAVHNGGGNALGCALAQKQYVIVEALLNAGANMHFKTGNSLFIDALYLAAAGNPELKQLVEPYLERRDEISALSSFMEY